MQLFTIFLALTAFAQSKQQNIGVGTLKTSIEFRVGAVPNELMRVKMTSQRVGEKQCGEYFIQVINPKDGTIGMMYYYAGKNGYSAVGIVAKSKLYIVVEERKYPIAQLAGGNRYQGVLVRISQEDYDNAKGCLPTPQ